MFRCFREFSVLDFKIRISDFQSNAKYENELQRWEFWFRISFLPFDWEIQKGFEKLSLGWPEPIYMRVGYVFESRFSAGMI